MVLLYVDDMDLFILDESIETPHDLWMMQQNALASWGNLLVGTGGDTKPDKSWGYLLHFKWDNMGQWSYANLADLGYTLEVPTENGMEEIDLFAPSISKQTLHVFTSPDGSSSHQLDMLCEKVAKQTYQMEIYLLPLLGQLYIPALDGIAIWLESDASYYGGCDRLPPGLLLQDATTHGRKQEDHDSIHFAFCGMGLFDFDTELCIAHLNVFLRHFDSPLSFGTTLRACLETVQLVAGL